MTWFNDMLMVGSDGRADRLGKEIVGKDMDEIDGKAGSDGKDIVILGKVKRGMRIGRGFSR